jgi:hypothetical protein
LTSQGLMAVIFMGRRAFRVGVGREGQNFAQIILCYVDRDNIVAIFQEVFLLLRAESAEYTKPHL